MLSHATDHITDLPKCLRIEFYFSCRFIPEKDEVQFGSELNAAVVGHYHFDSNQIFSHTSTMLASVFL